MKQEHCIRCGRLPEEKDRYCTNCGAPLQNKCTYDGGLLGDPCTAVNPPHAAFCSRCGAETIYKKTGLINSFYPPGKTDDDEWETMRLFNNRFFHTP